VVPQNRPTGNSAASLLITVDVTFHHDMSGMVNSLP
jgi:hypothetical protein